MERLRYARTWRSAIENITDLPFQASLRQMVRTFLGQALILLTLPPPGIAS